MKQFEKATQELHHLADELRKRMEQLHLKTIATRERARAARLAAQSRAEQRQRQAGEKRKTKRSG